MRELEHVEAVHLMTWVRSRMTLAEFPDLALLFHIPNGGKRHRKTAGKLKAEGVMAGVSDYLLPVPRPGFHGMFLELKAPGNTYPTTTQLEFMRAVAAQGYAVTWCRGRTPAKAALTKYLRGEWKNEGTHDEGE